MPAAIRMLYWVVRLPWGQIVEAVMPSGRGPGQSVGSVRLSFFLHEETLIFYSAKKINSSRGPISGQLPTQMANLVLSQDA